MSIQNIPGLASPADAWKDQPAAAPGPPGAHTKLLLSACNNTMLCCARSALEVGKVTLRFRERNEEL